MPITHADINAQQRVIQRRHPAARGFEYRKRSPQLNGDDDPPIFTGSGPFTFTTVRTLATLPGTFTRTSSTTSTTTSSTAIRTSSSSSSTTIASTSTSVTLTSTPVSPSASAIPQTSVSPTTSPTAGSENAQSTSLGTRALSGGAIAGIAIAVVIVVSVIIVFLVRKRMVEHRKDKRTNWLGPSPVIPPPPPAMTTVPLATPAVEAFKDAYARSASPPPPVPPVPQNLVPGSGGQGSVAIPPPAPAFAPAAPLVAPPPPSSFNNPPIVGGTIVKCTFIPNLDDELWITTGEIIKVLQEYDDGWAFCENSQMQRGMVPLECLDQGGKRESRPNLSRASSLSNRSK
ncbi:sh3 domain protein [Moniliophthora roreri MCA 2997]|uniref:Sh3 domain protein n=2 Tax=Moniliophthora roreri TaxID=221103 RepID=V2XBN2_MONRO|nr:sh3 domain protein [Moniliophthora roreri MCA 2997]